MKIVFAADLHGDASQYAELSSLVESVNPDALLLGGDLFQYSREAAPRLDFARGFLVSFFAAIECRTLWIPGNVDWPEAVRCLEGLTAAMPNVRRLSPASVRLPGEVSVVGYPYIPPSPFRIKHWERRDFATDRTRSPQPIFASDGEGGLRRVPPDYLDAFPSIEEDLAGVNQAGIWVVHVPPLGECLDVATPGNGRAGADQSHAGSAAVREAIATVQPALTLHGHIHEAPVVSGRWTERIGKTIAVNPGRGDRLHAVVAIVDRQSGVRRLRHTVFGDADIGALSGGGCT